MVFSMLCLLLLSLLMRYGMESIDSYLFLYMEEFGEAGLMYLTSQCWEGRSINAFGKVGMATSGSMSSEH